MKVLIVGGGGREHALAYRVAASPRVGAVFVAPGNAGTAAEPRVSNVAIAADDVEALLAFAMAQDVALTIVGPEAPLVLGIVDRFRLAGRACFGPTQAAARLEGSKSYAKQFLARNGIPTAGYKTFTRRNFDASFVQAQRLPLVVKADGLAAGKGVLIAHSHAEAVRGAEAMFDGQYGTAGNTIVIEEFLTGEEASFIVMVDGRNVLPLASSQDHKRLQDGDRGPNTGGMGAYSPAPVVTAAVHARAMREVILPTVRALAAQGTPYTGFLYAGLMVAADGTPNVLEFNCRLGDPEAQPILMRLRSDLTLLVEAALAGRLDAAHCEWDPLVAVGVVLAAPGYPDHVRTGDPIQGLAAAAALPGKVFHAGTTLRGDIPHTSGGRVLCAVGTGQGFTEARHGAYQLVACIHWPGMQYRTDIGHRALGRDQP